MTLLLASLTAALLPLLEGVGGPARQAAIDSLASACPPAELSAATAETDWRGRWGLIDALERQGTRSIRELVRLTAPQQPWDTRRRAVLALGEIGTTPARDALMDLEAASRDLDVVLRALGLLEDPTLIPVFQRRLSDASPHVRRQAVVALGRFGASVDPSSGAEALDDGHHSVRFAAADALGKMGERAGEAVRRRWDSLSSTGRMAALAALSAVGDSASTAFLKAVESGPDPILSAAAARLNSH